MASNKLKWLPYELPEGIAKHAYLNSPDVGREFSTGNYSVTLVYLAGSPQLAEAEKFFAARVAEREATMRAKTGKKVIKVENPLKPEIVKVKDSEGNDTGERIETGNKEIKLKVEPAWKDGTPRPLRLLAPTNDPATPVRRVKETIFGGSKLKVSIDMNPEPVTAKGQYFLQHRMIEVLVTELAERRTANSDPSKSRFGNVAEDEDDDNQSTDGETTDGKGNAGDF